MTSEILDYFSEYCPIEGVQLKVILLGIFRLLNVSVEF